MRTFYKYLFVKFEANVGYLLKDYPQTQIIKRLVSIFHRPRIKQTYVQDFFKKQNRRVHHTNSNQKLFISYSILSKRKSSIATKTLQVKNLNQMVYYKPFDRTLEIFLIVGSGSFLRLSISELWKFAQCPETYISKCTVSNTMATDLKKIFSKSYK